MDGGEGKGIVSGSRKVADIRIKVCSGNLSLRIKVDLIYSVFQ